MTSLDPTSRQNNTNPILVSGVPLESFVIDVANFVLAEPLVDSLNTLAVLR
jgi:hypothetical protein